MSNGRLSSKDIFAGLATLAVFCLGLLMFAMSDKTRALEPTTPVNIPEVKADWQSPEFVSFVGYDVLSEPMDIIVDDYYHLYVTDTGNNMVREFSLDGKLLNSFGEAGNAPGKLDYPYGINFSAQGNLLIAESGNERIQEFDRSGKFVRIFADKETVPQMNRPGALLMDRGTVYVADIKGDQVLVLNEKGEYIGVMGKSGKEKGQVQYPHGIAQDPEGRFWISDAGNNKVQVFSATGEYIMQIYGDENGQKAFGMIRGIAATRTGHMLVADTMEGKIRVFDKFGKQIDAFALQRRVPGEMPLPMGMFVDNYDRLYVADRGGNQIQIFNLRLAGTQR